MGQGHSNLTAREKIFLWGYQEYTLHETLHNNNNQQRTTSSLTGSNESSKGPSGDKGLSAKDTDMKGFVEAAVSEAFARVQQRKQASRHAHEHDEHEEDISGSMDEDSDEYGEFAHTTEGILNARDAGSWTPNPPSDRVEEVDKDPASPKAIAKRMHMTVGATNRNLLDALAECSPNRHNNNKASNASASSPLAVAPSKSGGGANPYSTTKNRQHDTSKGDTSAATTQCLPPTATYSSTAMSVYARDNQRRATEPFANQTDRNAVSNAANNKQHRMMSSLRRHPTYTNRNTSHIHNKNIRVSGGSMEGTISREMTPNSEADLSSDDDIPDPDALREAVSRAVKGPLPLHPAVVPRPISLLGMVLMTFDKARQEEHRRLVNHSLKAALLYNVATTLDFSNKGIDTTDYRLVNYILLNRRVFSTQDASTADNKTNDSDVVQLLRRQLQRAAHRNVEGGVCLPGDLDTVEIPPSTKHRLAALHVDAIDLSNNPKLGAAGITELTQPHSPLTNPTAAPDMVLQSSRLATAIYGGVATFITRLDLSRCNLGDEGAVRVATTLLCEAKIGTMIAVNRYDYKQQDRNDTKGSVNGEEYPYPLCTVKAKHEPYSRLHHGYTPLLPRLEELNLDSNDIGDIGFAAICEAIRVLFHTSAVERKRTLKHLGRHMDRKDSNRRSISLSASRASSMMSHELSSARQNDIPETPLRNGKQRQGGGGGHWGAGLTNPYTFNSPIAFDEGDTLHSPAPLIGGQPLPPYRQDSTTGKKRRNSDHAGLARKASATVGSYISTALHAVDVSSAPDYEETLLRRMNATVPIKRISVKNNRITDASCENLSSILRTRRIIQQYTSLAQVIAEESFHSEDDDDENDIDAMMATRTLPSPSGLPNKVVGLVSVDVTGNSLGNEGLLRICDALPTRLSINLDNREQVTTNSILPSTSPLSDDQAQSDSKAEVPLTSSLELRFAGNHITHQGVAFLQSAIDDVNEGMTIHHLATLEKIEESLNILRANLELSVEDAHERINGIDEAFDHQQQVVNGLTVAPISTPTRKRGGANRRGGGNTGQSVVSQQEILRQRLQLDRQRDHNEDQKKRIEAELHTHHIQATQALMDRALRSIYTSSALSGNITVLDLSHCQLGDTGLEALLGLINGLSETSSLLSNFGQDALHNIRSVAPNLNDIKGATRLHRHNFPHPLLHLRDLNLSYCGFTAYSLPALCAIFTCTSRMPHNNNHKNKNGRHKRHVSDSLDADNYLGRHESDVSVQSSNFYPSHRGGYLDAPIATQESTSIFQHQSSALPPSMLNRAKCLPSLAALKPFGKAAGLGQTFRGVAMAALQQQRILSQQQQRSFSIDANYNVNVSNGGGLGGYVAFQHSDSNVSRTFEQFNSQVVSRTHTGGLIAPLPSRRPTMIGEGAENEMSPKSSLEAESGPERCCTCALPYMTRLNISGNSLGSGQGQRPHTRGNTSGVAATTNVHALYSTLTSHTTTAGLPSSTTVDGKFGDAPEPNECATLLASLVTHSLNVACPTTKNDDHNHQQPLPTKVHIDVSSCKLGPGVAVDTSRMLLSQHWDAFLSGFYPVPTSLAALASSSSTHNKILQLSINMQDNELTHCSIIVLRDILSRVTSGVVYAALVEGIRGMPVPLTPTCNIAGNIVIAPRCSSSGKSNELDWAQLAESIPGVPDDYLVPIILALKETPDQHREHAAGNHHGVKQQHHQTESVSAAAAPVLKARGSLPPQYSTSKSPSHLPFSNTQHLLSAHSNSATPQRHSQAYGRPSHLTSAGTRDGSELVDECSPHSIRLDPSEPFVRKLAINRQRMYDQESSSLSCVIPTVTVTNASPRKDHRSVSSHATTSSAFSEHVFDYQDDEDEMATPPDDDVDNLRLPDYSYLQQRGTSPVGVGSCAARVEAVPATPSATMSSLITQNDDLEQLLSDADKLLEESNLSMAALVASATINNTSSSEPETKINPHRRPAKNEEELLVDENAAPIKHPAPSPQVIYTAIDLQSETINIKAPMCNSISSSPLTKKKTSKGLAASPKRSTNLRTKKMAK